MIIRKAETPDLPSVLDIYQNARDYMKANGNPNQWRDTYPTRNIVEEDIDRRRLYVCEEGEKIVGVFCFFVGREPTYDKIEDGTWLNDLAYGVIHRIAVVTHQRGVASQCFDYALQKCGNLRIDTHRDNMPMQKSLVKNGFAYCGIIHLENGDERLAYQKIDPLYTQRLLQQQPRILYDDPHIVVVEKPVGMPSQPDHSKQMSVLEYLQSLYPYVGLVHRLDTPTGGVMVYGKTPKSTAALSNTFAEKERMQKYYLAMLPCSPETPVGEMIDYLYHDTRANKSFVVESRRGASQLAQLSYEVIATLEDGVTLVKVHLYTGRSHQVRVQFAHRGMPLLGDGKYGSRYKLKSKGFALWAYEICFVHPQTKQNMQFVSIPSKGTHPWDMFDDVLSTLTQKGE